MFYFWVVIAYLSLLCLIALYRTRLVKTQEDFMVAGRRLPASILVLTLLSTWIGSGSILAGAELSYRRGFAALWLPAGAWAAIAVVYLIAGRARKLEQFTVPDVLELRYNGAARLLGTITTILAYTAIVSYQFRGGGIVLNVVTGMPLELGIPLTAAFVIAYTALAGMLSIAYIDILNGLAILSGISLSLPFLIDRVGGWAAVRAHLPAEHFSPFGTLGLAEALGYFLPSFLLLLGEANMYQKFFSARDESAARRAVIGWIAGTVLIETLIVAVAVVASSAFRNVPPDSIILHAARHGLPAAVGGLLLAASVAIIVSTADSFLFTPATNLVRDIYQRFVNPDASARRIVLCSRLAVLALGIFAFLQLRFFETVLRMALYAYTMYGASITPALVAAFIWRRATPAGGVASILAGMLTTLGWELAGRPLGLASIFPATALSIASLIAVSLLGAPPGEEKIRPFFAGR